MKGFFRTMSAAALALCAGSSLATITVTKSHGNSVIEATAISLGSNQWRVEITHKSTTIVPWVMIQGNNASDVIQVIEVFNTSGGTASVSINISDGSGGQTTIGAIEELWVQSPSTTRVGFSDLKFSGDFGTSTGANTCTVTRADWIDIGGDWWMDFTINAPSGTHNNGSLLIGGSLLGGSIYNNLGNISQVSVGGDIAGSALDPIEIWANGNIGAIVADSIAEVRIGSQTAGFSGTSTVTSITTLTGDFSSSSTMTMTSLGAMDIDGDFDADVTISNAMASSSTLFRIGDSFVSTAILSLPTNGLVGQVRINANGGSGQFLGDVEVGATTLNANYTTLSTNLGNGVAGAAPFNFHQFTGPLPGSRADLDCNPFHTEVLYVGECEEVESLEEVVIDHYGHVFVNGSGPHYRVEFRSDVLPSSWTDVTSLYEVDTTKTSTADGGSNRAVYLKPASGNSTAFNSSGWFRFRPLAGKVKSANVTGTPDVVYDSSITSGDLGSGSGTQYDWYQFRVRLSLCDGLTIFEGDQVNAADIAAWADQPFEVNCDGQICEQDLADMLSAYSN